MMPNFFKAMPKKDFNEKGKWKIQVITMFFSKDNIAFEEVYEGRKGLAYIKIRLKALWKDWCTQGNYYGIGWTFENMTKEEELKSEVS